jgi:hypothetical protein
MLATNGKIIIEIPEGKTANQESKKGKLIISFKDKPKGKITDRVKDFVDACIEDGIKPADVYNSSETEDEIAYKKLKRIAKVLNEGWEPNWNDGNERKWWPWFKWSAGSGFDFSYSGYLCDHSHATVGSRFCLKSEELANYFGKQFLPIHNDLLIIKK